MYPLFWRSASRRSADNQEDTWRFSTRLFTAVTTKWTITAKAMLTTKLQRKKKTTTRKRKRRKKRAQQKEPRESVEPVQGGVKEVVVEVPAVEKPARKAPAVNRRPRRQLRRRQRSEESGEESGAKEAAPKKRPRRQLRRRPRRRRRRKPRRRLRQESCEKSGEKDGKEGAKKPPEKAGRRNQLTRPHAVFNACKLSYYPGKRPSRAALPGYFGRFCLSH